MNGLFVFEGEAFRGGGQNCRARGHKNSYEPQKTACMSHLELLDMLETRFNIKCDVIINTYSTSYDNDMCEWYKKYLVKSAFHDSVLGWDNLNRDTFVKIKELDFEKYDFVKIFRIDLFLKPVYKEKFPEILDKNKIVYPFICFMFRDYHLTPQKNPRISDMFVFIPRRHYRIIENNIHILHHEGVDVLLREAFKLDEDITFMLFTYHDSDSEKDWNPLYLLVNRGEKQEWYSKHYVYDQVTHLPIQERIEYKEYTINQI
jgi:hypothetical protein